MKLIRCADSCASIRFHEREVDRLPVTAESFRDRISTRPKTRRLRMTTVRIRRHTSQRRS